MKSFLKILVLGVVPILAATAVVDQGLAADKGSQLIFHTNMAHKNFISIANTNDASGVTVLTQYYNDDMARVLYFLRVIPGGGNVLFDPFDHEIPGTEANVSEVLAGLPAMTQTTGQKLPGINSGRFLVVVTAVGANMGVDTNGNDIIADVVAADANAATGTATAVGGYRIRTHPTTGKDEIVLIRKQTPAGANATPTYDVPYTPADTGTTAAFVFSAETNRAQTVNALFPEFLAEDMHGISNIDNGGVLSLVGDGLVLTNEDEIITVGDDGIAKDISTKNVGDWGVDNAIPIAFNHLTGHFTEALVSTASGGADQTASWGGTPIIRPAVSNTANGMATYSNNAAATATNPARMTFGMKDYTPLNGLDSEPVFNHTDQGWLSQTDYNNIVTDATTTPPTRITPLVTTTPPAVSPATNFDHASVVGFKGGRLAEKNAGGDGRNITSDPVTKGTAMRGFTSPSPKASSPAAVSNRGLIGGALVLPALHGGGAETKQIMLFLSVSDAPSYGAGSYILQKAMTKYMVTVHDNMGNKLPNPADDRLFGSSGGPQLKGTSIIVEGMTVTTDAGTCGPRVATNMPLDGYWTLDHLISDVPTAASGSEDFAGLDVMLDPMKNATPGYIKFERVNLSCSESYGDGDNNDDDGIPAVDNRAYKGGTLIEEEPNSHRTFVTTGQALLKFLTSESTFGASWSLKSPN